MDTLDKVDFYKIVPELITQMEMEMDTSGCDNINIDKLYEKLIDIILDKTITGFGSTFTIKAAKALISTKKEYIIGLIEEQKPNIINKCRSKTYEKNKEIVYIVINSILAKYKESKYNKPNYKNNKMSNLSKRWEEYNRKNPVNPSGGKHRKTLNRKKTLKRKKSSLYKSRRRL